MALTKVSGGILDPGINVAGIVTATGFDGPFTGGSSKNITAGIITATGLDVNGNGDISGNLVVGGNLTANGDFTTLNTTLREVELLRVDANSSTAAGIITQRGSGDLLQFFDTSTQVGALTDEGNFGLGVNAPNVKLHVKGTDTGGGNIAYFDDSGSGNTGRLMILTTGGAATDGIKLQTVNRKYTYFGSGTTHFTIDNNNARVGIGSDIPTAPLDVSGRAQIGGTAQITGTPYSYFYGRGNGGDGVSIYAGEPSLELVGTNGGSHAASLLFRTAAHDGIGFNYNPGGNVLELKSFDATGNNFQIHASGSNVSNLKDILKATAGAGLQLFHNNEKKFETQADGCHIYGSYGLQIYGGLAGTNSNAQLGLYPTGTAVYSYFKGFKSDGSRSAGLTIYDGSNCYLDTATNGSNYYRAYGTGDHYFQNNGQHTLRILDSGFVGIGTGNPSALLDVNKGTQANIQLKTTQPGSINSMSFAIGSATNQIFSRGANSSTPRNFVIGMGSTEVFRIDTTGNIILKDPLAQGNSLVHYIQATDVNGAGQYYFGMLSTGNQDLYIQQTKNANLRFQTSATTRWYIDGDPGHLLPETAGAVDIGSTSAEIGNVYIADNKKVFLGSDQYASMYHTGSKAIIDNSTGDLDIRGDVVRIKKYDASKTMASFIAGGQAEFNFDTTRRLHTTPTGIFVTGEVAASQDYPLSRPTLDLNFAAQKKLDPRITYQRTGVASFIDKFGLVKIVGDNVPRFDHDPDTGECKGLLIEEARTNLQPHSEQYSPDSADGFVNFPSGMTVDYDPGVVTPTGETTGAITFIESGGGGQHYLALDHFGAVTSGQTYTFSFFIKNISGSDTDNVKIITTTAAFPYYVRSYYFAGANAGTTSYPADSSMIKLPNGWWKCMITLTTNNNFASPAFSIDFRGYGSGAAYDNKIALWGLTTELGAFPTSYIRTGNSDYGDVATRGADLVEITEEEFSEFYNRTEGSIVSEIMLPSSWPISGYGSYMMTLSDGSYNNRVTLASSTGSAQFNADINIGSNNPTRANLGSYTSGSHSIKAAMAYKISDSAGSLNGAAAVTSSPSGTLPLLTRADIGKDHANYNLLNGHVKRIMYYSKRLSNNQLRTLTS